MSGTILVYGGSGGIGAATARHLGNRGYATHLVGRDADRLAQVAHLTGGRFSVADVEDTTSFAKVMDEVNGPLAGLVYAIGTITLKPISRVSVADMDRDFRINALGAALAVQAALPALKACEGPASIVLYSSVAASQGFNAHCSIAMAKGAIEGLARTLAAELAPKIRVNAIAPSLTRTTLSSSLTANEHMAGAIAQMHPLGRLGEADDVAALTAFLISKEASWITGQVIGVDGGRSSLRTRG